MLEKIGRCPECNSEMTKGWIGERGWIRWYDKPKRTFTIFGLGEDLLTSGFWGTKLGKQEAKRCLSCGLVLFKSDPVRKPFIRRVSRIALYLAVILLCLWITKSTLEYLLPPRPPVPEMAKIMKNVSATDGFRYFSGYYDTLNNLPAMYAHGTSSEGGKLTVVGPGMEQDFPIRQIDRAFSLYRELLRTRGYIH
jgi:hypothetical protein